MTESNYRLSAGEMTALESRTDLPEAFEATII